ncbi:MAG: hypothetical protein WC908_01365 [Candidatus Paceibacterota bacterium]
MTGIIIDNKGLDGSATFYVYFFQADGKRITLSIGNKEKTFEFISGNYPQIANNFSIFYDKRIEYPKEIAELDSTPREELLKLFSKEFLK